MDLSLLEPFECRVAPKAFSQKKKEISHFRLVRQPPSMKTLVDLFQGEELRFIWTSDCSFLRLCSSAPQEDGVYDYADNYETIFGIVELGDPAGQKHFLCIYASTPKAAKACLNSLCAVDDDHFVSFSNKSWLLIDEEDEMLSDNVIPCPHSSYALELLGCSSPKRQVSFENMSFRGDQAMLLVKPGGSLLFDSCFFIDGDGNFDGEFVNALNALQDGEKLKRLTCISNHPFAAYELWGSDAITRVEHIVLDNLVPLPIETIENVGRVENITLVDCMCARGGSEGSILLDDLASSTSLRSLTFQLGYAENLVDENQFLWMEFFCNLRQQRTLERLVFSGYAFPSNEIEELLRSIHHIPTLRHLTLSLEYLCSEEWNKYLSILSRNRYLRSLDFEKVHYSENAEDCLQKELAHSLSRFIRQNQYIESAKYNASVFDQESWNAKVVPMLDCNRYRPKFLPIPSIRKNRPAILGASLASVSAKPHLIWMLVKPNQDTLAHQLDNAARHQSSPSPKKRQRI